jgi:hypothetical protein
MLLAMAMNIDTQHPEEQQDTFGDRVGVLVLEQTAALVTVSQSDRPELQNHVGVRHASALFAGAYDALRLLVHRAVAQTPTPASIRLVQAHIEYTNLPMGEILTTAEPTGEAWTELADRLAAGRPVSLEASAISRIAGASPVATLHTIWRVCPTV